MPQKRHPAERPATSRQRLSVGAWGPIAVAALAFVLRVIYLLSARQSPLFENLGLDARFYDLWARKIASTDWIGSEPFFMGPLYPYFLAVLYRIGLSPVFQVALVQAAIDAATCALLFVAARRLWARPWAGWAAGLLAAFYGPMMLYTGELLYPTLAVFVHALFLYLVLASEGRANSRLLFASGVVLGIAAFGNATSLVFYPAVVVWWLLRKPRPAVSRLVRPALILLAGVATVLVPVAARNRIVGHDWVLLTSNGGLNFYIGNNASASGAYLRPMGLDVMEDPEGRRIAEAALGRSLRPSEVSAYWAGEARAFVRDHPDAFVSGFLKKMVFFWNAYEIPQIENLGFQSRQSPLLRLPFPTYGWIVPLALVALVLGGGRRREAALPAGMAAAYSVAIALFFVTGRYRMPVGPCLIVLAAGGIPGLVDSFTGRRRRVLGIAVLAAAAALAHANLYHVDRTSGFAEFEYRTGLNYELAGDLGKAEEHYRSALAHEAFHPGARLNLGVILSRTGRVEEGLHLVETLAAERPDHDKAHFNLGVILADLGRHDEARAAYAQAVRVNPTYTQAWHAYGLESYRAGDAGEARRALERVAARGEDADAAAWVLQSRFLLEKMGRGWVAREGDSPPARAMREGDLQAMTGDWQGAGDEYRRAANLQPSPAAYLEMGQAAFRLKKTDEAFDALRRCLALDPRLPGAHALMAAVHVLREEYDAALEENEREAEVSPGDPEVFFRLGLLYENHTKDIPAALRAYRRYLELGGPRADLVRQRMSNLEGQVNP